MQVYTLAKFLFELRIKIGRYYRKFVSILILFKVSCQKIYSYQINTMAPLQSGNDKINEIKKENQI